MSEMSERVAMRMWVDYVQSASPPVEWHKSKDVGHWLSVASNREREAWRRSARVALKAMRYPTEDMVDFARKKAPYNRDAEEIWGDMIDAALQ